MARNSRGLVRGQLRALFDAGTVAGLTDGQLLERFATRRDEAAELAFAALVERHGPMVLRVCRGILRDEHDAMDAFQATFLVLARHGGSLWVLDSLGPWLHRVACHAAGRARRTKARRLALEKRVAEMADARGGGGGVDQGERDEIAAVLHEEVNRLPERYRAAVVLCDLEGRTCEDAARHLGCPVGTIKSRLSRGRERLRDRLRRRGLPAAIATSQGLVMPFPPELVGSTAVAAARFLSIRASQSGPAALLALGVLRTMTIIRWWKIAAVVCVMAASTTGALSLAGRDDAVAQGKPDDFPKARLADGVAVTQVEPGTLSVVVHERGSLESIQNPEIVSQVDGQTKIVSVLPEGTRVTSGQLICELDSAGPRDRLANQRAVVETATAAFRTSKSIREAAESAVAEYLDGIYPRDLRIAANEVELARSSIAAAEERVERVRATRKRLNALLDGQGGAKTAGDLTAVLDLDERIAAAGLDLDRRRRDLEVRRAGRDVLERFTKDKMVKQLRVDVEKAREVEMARQQAADLEQKRAAGLEEQVARCKIVAPSDGFLVYVDDPMRVPSRLEKGAIVRAGQTLFHLPDISRLQVNTKVHESIVHRVRPGLRARIRVDAFADASFSGTVVDVAPRPDRRDAFAAKSNVKVYATHVSIDRGTARLRPGMTAAIEILVTELDNVLSVPVTAVVRIDDQDQVAVKTPAGAFEWRAVTLGMTNDKVVEVKHGLERGEAVAIVAAPLLSDEQKRKAALSPTRPAAPRTYRR